MKNKIIEKIRNRKLKISGYSNLKKYGVLVPLIKSDDKYHLLFEIRSDKLSTQPGEISFPGGGKELSDKNILETAIRETEEELGISKSSIEILSHLDTLITPFNIVLRPFLGYIEDLDSLKPNKNEVKDTFCVPLEFFINNEPELYHIDLKAEIAPDREFPEHIIGKDYNWRVGTYPVYFYYYEDKVIWGLTAKIIKNLTDIINERDINDN